MLWILGSDQLAFFLEHTYGVSHTIETYKGIFFVLISGLLLFVLLRSLLKEHEASFQEYLREKDVLLEQLRVRNAELLDAYDRTIFGWSRVLEMRNREVKDHSQRVTEMTLRLARRLGLNEAELVHIRRGALLHDIGKMAIPDEVILKNGDLNEEERSLVQRHPLLGFEMVSEIEFLRPAMDILLCHHERWDGTGYPFGLVGEQIPYSARIFSVVDVWDALRYDRVYRKGDSAPTVAEYMRSQSGLQFDPQILRVFLEMLEEEGLPKTDAFPVKKVIVPLRRSP